MIHLWWIIPSAALYIVYLVGYTKEKQRLEYEAANVAYAYAVELASSSLFNESTADTDSRLRTYQAEVERYREIAYLTARYHAKIWPYKHQPYKWLLNRSHLGRRFLQELEYKIDCKAAEYYIRREKTLSWLRARDGLLPRIGEQLITGEFRDKFGAVIKIAVPVYVLYFGFSVLVLGLEVGMAAANALLVLLVGLTSGALVGVLAPKVIKAVRRKQNKT